MLFNNIYYNIYIYILHPPNAHIFGRSIFASQGFLTTFSRRVADPKPLDNEYVEEDSEGISTLRRITIYFCFFTHYPQGYIRVRPFRLVVSGRI